VLSTSSRLALIPLCAVACLATATAVQAAERPATIVKASRTQGGDGSLSPVAAEALRRGYVRKAHPPRPTSASGNGSAGAARTPSLALAPNTIRSWTGVNDTFTAPPDPTGAVGTQRFIELVNSSMGIYSRAQSTPLFRGSLQSLAAQPGNFVGDPQVIWDPTTNRFYYAMFDVASDTDNRLAFGWSRTATPGNSGSDWCHYVLKYGARFPDFPKLGDSRDFLLIGVNADGARADVAWVSKPGGGQACPSRAALDSGIRTDLRDANGFHAFTPVPANEIDTQAAGWVVAAAQDYEGLSVFKVARKADGTASVQAMADNVPVAGFDWPGLAPQPGTANRLDTSDSRLTSAVGAIDPAHGGRFAVWTQHAVEGGAGSMVRWYEVDPSQPVMVQKGQVSSPSLYAFNAAISADRVVNGGGARGGGSMAMTFNTSSSASNPAIRIVSKVGGAAQSSPLLVKQSPGALGGFDCDDSQHFCRWGDYAGATPDPAPPAGETRIWLVNEWASGQSTSNAQSKTQNTIVSP
jgi:hypothetical protein